MTKTSDWTPVLKNGQPGRPVAPVLYTGGGKLFGVKMDIEKVRGMMDANGDLRYSRIFDDLLPTIGDEHLYAYLAARARSYMTYLMVQRNIEVQRNWKPRYYKPDEGLIILTDHIARFYGYASLRDRTMDFHLLTTAGPRGIPLTLRQLVR